MADFAEVVILERELVERHDVALGDWSPVGR